MKLNYLFHVVPSWDCSHYKSYYYFQKFLVMLKLGLRSRNVLQLQVNMWNLCRANHKCLQTDSSFQDREQIIIGTIKSRTDPRKYILWDGKTSQAFLLNPQNPLTLKLHFHKWDLSISAFPFTLSQWKINPLSFGTVHKIWQIVRNKTHFIAFNFNSISTNTKLTCNFIRNSNSVHLY